MRRSLPKTEQAPPFIFYALTALTLIAIAMCLLILCGRL